LWPAAVDGERTGPDRLLPFHRLVPISVVMRKADIPFYSITPFAATLNTFASGTAVRRSTRYGECQDSRTAFAQKLSRSFCP
jgi:hypothetical protein